MDDEVRVELARLHDEDRRQNRRLDLLEKDLKVIQELAISVHTLAHDMQQMLEEQKSQGERLDRLEKEPGDTWKEVKKVFVTGIVSAFAGGLVTALAFILTHTL